MNPQDSAYKRSSTIYNSPQPNFNDSVSLGSFKNFTPSAWTPYRHGNESKSFGRLNKWRNASPANNINSPFTPQKGASCSLGRPRLIDFDDSSFNTTVNSTFSNRGVIRSTLPSWAVDEQGNVAEHVTLRDVLQKDALFEFSADKNGCRFLQEQYPSHSDNGIHDEVFKKVVEKRDVFLTICRNMFGNFFIQRIVECSRSEEQEFVMEHLVTEMFSLCLDKSACRVIQLAIQKLDTHLASRLSLQLRGSDLVQLSIDQNGNHVIQKIIKTLPITAWHFVVDYFQNDEYLIAVCQDKYGCRVIQSTIEKLTENPLAPCYQKRVQLLRQLMDGVTRNCAQLASNEFANYVVQHVVKSGGVMETYRDQIIKNCLLRNLLSMAQEKYASHVVEISFLYAPHNLLVDMMEEIFEGYIPHPETNRDALDILLFHQYGNYIIQQMIHICSVVVFEKTSSTKIDPTQIELYATWLERIKDRVVRNTPRLERFSSGKKIIEALDKCLEH